MHSLITLYLLVYVKTEVAVFQLLYSLGIYHEEFVCVWVAFSSPFMSLLLIIYSFLSSGFLLVALFIKLENMVGTTITMTY